MSVQFGFVVAAGPDREAPERYLDDLDRHKVAIERQFSSLWMTDHFFWEDAPTYEAWTAMAYLAARFPAMQVGPMVLGQSYRNPAVLAKMAATLQQLSGGRFIMAIGAGWKEDEYRAYHIPYPPLKTRLEELEDTLEILKRLWTEPGKVTYHGKHYSVDDAWCEPKPLPVPPIIVGGGGRTTLRLAARYADWWNIPDAAWAKYSTRLSLLKEQCAAVGRDEATLRKTWFGRLSVGATEAEAEARSAGKWTAANSFTGTRDQVVELMRPFVEAGVDYFMVEVLDYAEPGVLDRVAEIQQAVGEIASRR